MHFIVVVNLVDCSDADEPLANHEMAFIARILMGVQPCTILGMSAAAPTSNSHLHTDRWPSPQAMYMGVAPLLSALVMSAAAPTSNSHLHTDRWPSWQAMYMGVMPLFFALVMSAATHEQPRAHRQVAILAGDVHGSGAVVARLGDVRGRAHFEQPLAHRQVAILAGDPHGSDAVVVRLADVRGRAHLEQPLAPTAGPPGRRRTWE